MKGKKVSLIAACMAGAMMFSGCSMMKTPYDLTEEEEAIIVNYAAHVVSKFNNYQGDGLTYVLEEEPEEETEVPEEVAATEDTETSEEVSGGAVSGEATDAVVESAADLNQVFGTDALTISYTGYEIKPSFTDPDTYALDAAAGKTYLILYIDIANSSEQDVVLDNLTAGPSFKVTFTDQNGENIRASAYTTILLSDFSTYTETVAAGAVNEAVLLFEVPDSVTAAEQIVVQVNINGTTYAINL